MVKFDLETDASVVSRVAEALVADHRISVPVVAVTHDRGVVTLSGQVADPNTREAAARVAARQPGVVEVINDLEVRIDDPTELLRYRKMVLSHNTRRDSPSPQPPDR